MKKYTPTIVTACVMLTGFLAMRFGVLTQEQVFALFAALGLSGTAFAKPVR